jgi:hypothetical protein
LSIQFALPVPLPFPVHYSAILGVYSSLLRCNLLSLLERRLVGFCTFVSLTPLLSIESDGRHSGCEFFFGEFWLLVIHY